MAAATRPGYDASPLRWRSPRLRRYDSISSPPSAASVGC